MMHYSRSQMALLTAICMLGIACTEGPTGSAAGLTGPEFAKGGKGGKGGKGKPAGDPPIIVTFADRAGDKVTSDVGGSYVDGECNVDATFNIDDARLFLGGRIKKKEQETCGDPRRVMVAFTDPVGGSQPGGRDFTTVGATFFKVNEVEQVTVALETVGRTAVIGGAGCAHQLKFNPNQDSKSNDVEVTKHANGTWTVATRPYPNNVAVCIPDEDRANPPLRSYYHMKFSLTVVLK